MEETVKMLCEKGLKLTAAESCTGGLFAASITAVSGSSTCFEGSVVTYSNRQKTRLLGVKSQTLEKFGAVSYQTALEMAKGVRVSFDADFGIGITGIAGPTGGTAKKPVGTVFIAISQKGGQIACKCHFDGNRDEVRQMAVEFAKNLVSEAVKKC